jgi:hypothetical protein
MASFTDVLCLADLAVYGLTARYAVINPDSFSKIHKFYVCTGIYAGDNNGFFPHQRGRAGTLCLKKERSRLGSGEKKIPNVLLTLPRTEVEQYGRSQHLLYRIYHRGRKIHSIFEYPCPVWLIGVDPVVLAGNIRRLPGNTYG